MSDGRSQGLSAQMLDFSSSDERAGFRLAGFEVYNWGTFHEKVWSLEPGGQNALLTGDIGSGKSTLVDALTVLLVLPQRIIFNKAAGAEARERSLRTYVLGHYRMARGDEGSSARSMALRGPNDYSVILARFANEGYNQCVTLAQVFWMQGTQSQPERFYVVADQPLHISGNFDAFGSEITDLRKRLRQEPHVEVFDTFPPYGAAFRRRFGIENSQALELFNQTVSMKSVGNLTDFVREHMLEAFPVDERIQALIAHFDDLDRAHRAVLKARDQIAALQPMVEAADQYGALKKRVAELRACRDALSPWFAQLKGDLLKKRLENLDRDLRRLSARIEELDEARNRQEMCRDDIRQSIAQSGGDRLARLKSEIAGFETLKEERKKRADAYQTLTGTLDLPEAATMAGFEENRLRVQRDLDEVRESESAVQNRLTDAEIEFRRGKALHDETTAELVSLRKRRSNLPSHILVMRDQLLKETGLGESDLLFAGELIQVRPEYADWEGAIERVLHNFALSMLVPDDHYGTVAAWVDRTHLRGRFVYYRVQALRHTPVSDLSSNSLVHRVTLQPDSAFYHWLSRDLAERFDYTCCEDLDAFRREKKAITRAGQMKSNGVRHEKDDRYAIDDRTRFVLGWSNEAKIAALEKQCADQEVRLQVLAGKVAGAQEELKHIRERKDAMNRISTFETFRDIDWRQPTVQIDRLEAERRHIQSSSDVLKTLEMQLNAVNEDLKASEAAREQVQRDLGATGEKAQAARTALEDCRMVLQDTPEEVRAICFARLEDMRGEALGDHGLTVESCDGRQTKMREWLQAKIDAEDKRIQGLSNRMVDAMRSYKNAWPAETIEMDVSVEAAEEYREMLRRLEADDLPRFETHFKALLNENTIREVANFQAQLNREREEIRERIEAINRSLRGIEYGRGRHIKLLADPAQDVDVRSFREELRACTEGAITGSENEQYSEAKFMQVKGIIERLRGREGQTDADERWKRKVTDVRNYFLFSASERWNEDDVEYEHYTDSGGKSGGQKEKLAYTVLAASLAYQFGLEWGEKQSRSFRFVVIDEAFGRGSDESTRYALELFKKLNLQLLIVTPLQKIHTIEPYISTVGFVHSEDGRCSLLRKLTIEEYRREQAARRMMKVV